MKYKIIYAVSACLILCGNAVPAGASSLSTTTLITPGVDGAGANGRFLPGNGRSLSRDGRISVFATQATNQVPSDTNGASDVFAYDRITKKTELVSHTPAGQPANGESMYPSVSADGRYVAYFSSATNIVSGVSPNCPTPNQCGMVIVYDRTAAGFTVSTSALPGGSILNFDYGVIA